MKLIDILKMVETDFEDEIERQKEKKDIRPNSCFKICLCFMGEEETWVTVPTTHPILKQYYNCEVNAISPADNDTLEVWLNEKYWWGKEVEE